jgi:hypothetical protein
MAGIFGLLMSGAGVLKDQYFNLTSLLLPGNGTNGKKNNDFVDSSTANSGTGWPITPNGDVTQGTFSPFSQTGWGNYFDGTGDCLSIPTSAISSVGSNDFSMECWVYLLRQTNTLSQGLISYGVSGSTAGTSYISFELTPSGYAAVAFASATALAITSSTITPINQWAHIALCRSGSTLSIFLNGSRVATTSTSATVGSTGNVLFVGSQWYANEATRNLQGYISNARIVNGSSAYDATQSTINVPTLPLTAISNTSLLTCQSNRFRDASSNNFAITVNGNTSVTPFSPFAPTSSYSAAAVGGSGYFDGSGDSLSAASNAAFAIGTGDFSIECWIYFLGTARGGGASGEFFGSTTTGSIVLRYISGTLAISRTNTADDISASVTLTTGQWYHICATRTGTTGGLYLNGDRVATNSSYTASYAQGDMQCISGTNGYLSSCRLVKGSNPYGTGSTITLPTAPLTAVSGTSLLLNFTNAGVVDATAKNVLETEGNAQISTAQSKWGGGSMYFNGSSSYLMSAANQAYELGSGDFTIECWVNISAAASDAGIVGKGPVGSVNNSIWSIEFVGTGNTIGFYAPAAAASFIITGTTNIKSSTWTHIAVSRSGNNTRLFVNGTQEGSTYTSGYTITTGNNLYVGGGFYAPTTRTITGYVDDLRITKYGRYTANFTPPTAPFPLQ